MSKNQVYYKAGGYRQGGIQQPLRSPERSTSMTPSKRAARKSPLGQTLLKEQLMSTEAKYQGEDELGYGNNRRQLAYDDVGTTGKKYTGGIVSGKQTQNNYTSPNNYMSPFKQAQYPKGQDEYPKAQSRMGTRKPLQPSSNNVNRAELLREQLTYLEQENIHLHELIKEKSRLMAALEKKLQQQVQQQVLTLQQIQRQKNRFLTQFHQRDDLQRVQIQRLLIQLRNQQQHSIMQQKSNQQQLQLAKRSFTQQKHVLLDTINQCQKQLKRKQSLTYQLQKQLDQKTIELRTIEQTAKHNQAHLSQQITKLLGQLQQVNHEKKILLSEQKVAFDNTILTMKKEHQQVLASEKFVLQSEIKRLKALLNQQMLSNNHLQYKAETGRLQHTNQINQLKKKQAELKHQVHEVQIFCQQKALKQLEKQRELSHQEFQMVNQALRLKENQAEEQTKNLLIVNRQNRTQIQQLCKELDQLRKDKQQEVERLQQINHQLRARIVELCEETQDNTESLKVKLGQLRHTDIVTLQEYYQHQIELRDQQVLELEAAVKENRNKLHLELETKVLERKAHQQQADHLKIRIGELELKLAQITEEHRQQMHSMGSQIQMTSQTLIRESHQKNKYSQQAEQEKKNLQELINVKDGEIQELNKKIVRMKNAHTEEVQEKETSLKMLDEKVMQVNDQLKREREFYQKELAKKEQQKKETKEFYEAQLNSQKMTYQQELQETSETLLKQIKDLTLKVQGLTLSEKQLKDELSLHSEHHEQRQLEKEVSHNEEKSRMEYQRQNLELNLKNYYQKKISQVQEQLKTTKQQLLQKSSDFRALQEKYARLQKKLEKAIQSQDKMRVLEEKVMALGQENNLVKNVGELAKGKRTKIA